MPFSKFQHWEKKPKPKKVKRGNTVRKISTITKSEVYERDKGKCIICGKGTAHPEYHHCYYGPMTNYGPNRNDPNQLVILCHSCHNRLHFEGSSNWMRQECIIYLNRLYGKIQS